ncbi:hypothetical protein [Pelomonas sp. Root1444]|uniref:hypothetical protein n=1 Tax=Pelomonas sp. Root1444 TaxID=1736464 RepID=UPI000702FF71|nr:hypothetical protein [Pelomonas sp. Root1444]KQY81834.1 hypothetical protein ASD35_08605 [Pelomonas sp. Root1444]
MNNPLRHVGQSARPEEAAKPSPDDQAGDAGAEARQQNPTDAPGGTLEQHPRTTPSAPTTRATPATGPRAANKEIKDLEPGEPPPESSAGS